MYQFFILLMVLCAVMFIVSLIRPRWGTFGKKPEWKRKRLCPFYFVLFIAFALLSNYTMPEDVRIANQQRQEQRQEQKRLEAQQKEEKERAEAEQKQEKERVEAEQKQQAEEQKQQEEEQKALAEKESKDIFCRNYGLSLDQAQAIESALDSVGLGEVSDTTKEGSYIKLNVNANDTDYTPKDGVVKVFLDNDNNLQAIKIGSRSLYDNGQVVCQVSDVLVSLKDMSEAIVSSEEIVNNVLKAPSTANYDTDTFRFIKQDGLITTIGTVDAQNSFGAMIRTGFKIQFDYNDGMKPVHFVFDDQEIF